MSGLYVALATFSLLCFWVIFKPLKVWTKGKALFALCFALLVCGALLLSWLEREQADLIRYQDEERRHSQMVVDYLSGKDIDTSKAEPIAFVRSLQRYLQLNYRDSQAWLLLGNLLSNEQDMSYSLMAFQRAHRVNPHDTQLALDYANVRIANLNQRNDTRLDMEVVDLLEDILKADSFSSGQYENALMLLGVASFQGQDYVRAEKAWTELMQQLKQLSIEREVPENVLSALQTNIDRARAGQNDQKLGLPAKNTVDSIDFSINIQVDLGAEARAYFSKHSLPSSATLFIYVKSGGANASPMPLAAIRKPLQGLEEFPVTVELTQAHSLMGTDLSAEASLQLGAKISLSGEAKTNPGDWQSEQEMLLNSSGAKSIALKISKTVD